MLLMDLLFCETTSAIWQFVGYLFLALKTIIPLIIIILGIVDLVKAVLASKDDGLPAAFKSLIMRLILGFSIFFIPTIISMAFSLVKDSATFINASDACQVCLLRPTSDECVTYKDTAEQDRLDRNNGYKEPNDNGTNNGGSNNSGSNNGSGGSSSVEGGSGSVGGGSGGGSR